MEGMKWQYIIWIVFSYVLSLRFVQGKMNNSYSDPDSLDSFLHDYAVKSLVKPRTGTLYNVSLPSNFSGIDVSIVRIRSSALWNRGANITFFHIPPRVLPWPFARRIDLISQNLGNWSSYYYRVPNHTLVAPVIGLTAYDSNRSSAAADAGIMVQLSMMGADSTIQVHFPDHQIFLPGENKNVTVKCVRFGTNGVVEFSNLNKTNTCVAKGSGHFSLVIPESSPESKKIKKKARRPWKLWAIGFGVGIAGAILLVVFIAFVYKIVSANRIAQMERQSEKGETLDSIWIGKSRMPVATGIRTQPAIENSYVP